MLLQGPGGSHQQPPGPAGLGGVSSASEYQKSETVHFLKTPVWLLSRVTTTTITYPGGARVEKVITEVFQREPAVLAGNYVRPALIAMQEVSL